MIEQGKKLPISKKSELYVISNNNQWREYALCQDKPYELYFPQKRKNKTKYTNRNYYEAQELCLHCPVKFECLAFAVSNKLSFGTFCLPATERKKIKITTDLKSFIKKVVQRRDIMETKFNPDGSLLNKRCVQCHRKTKHFYFDAGGWSALRNQCVDCAIEIQQNKSLIIAGIQRATQSLMSGVFLFQRFVRNVRKGTKRTNTPKELQVLGEEQVGVENVLRSIRNNGKLRIKNETI